MSKVTIGYWEAKFPSTKNGEFYPHITLKTENWYVDFQPNLKEEKDKRIDPGKSYPGKFISTEDGQFLGKKPDKEIDFINLNVAEIEKSIDLLVKNQDELRWKIWGSEYDQCFNGASIIALLLRIGGVADSLNQSQFQAEHKEAKNMYRALFCMEKPQDMGAFYHFAQISHQEITPGLIISLPHHTPKCPPLASLLSGAQSCLIWGVQGALIKGETMLNAGGQLLGKMLPATRSGDNPIVKEELDDVGGPFELIGGEGEDVENPPPAMDNCRIR